MQSGRQFLEVALDFWTGIQRGFQFCLLTWRNIYRLTVKANEVVVVGRSFVFGENCIGGVLRRHPGRDKVVLQPANPAALHILNELLVIHGAHFDFFVWLIWCPDGSTKISCGTGGGDRKSTRLN